MPSVISASVLVHAVYVLLEETGMHANVEAVMDAETMAEGKGSAGRIHAYKLAE